MKTLILFLIILLIPLSCNRNNYFPDGFNEIYNKCLEFEEYLYGNGFTINEKTPDIFNDYIKYTYDRYGGLPIGNERKIILDTNIVGDEFHIEICYFDVCEIVVIRLYK